MDKALIAAIVTLVIGALVELTIGARWNVPGIGCIVSVAVMGAFIIFFNEKKNK